MQPGNGTIIRTLPGSAKVLFTEVVDGIVKPTPETGLTNFRGLKRRRINDSDERMMVNGPVNNNAKRMRSAFQHDERSILALFNQYANRDPGLPNKIGPCGVALLLHHVNVDSNDISVLIFAWKLNATIQCEFSFQEWLTGLTSIQCFDLGSLAQWFQRARQEIAYQVNFVKFYKFAFEYAKPLFSKNISLDRAAYYWRVIYGQHPEIERWINYLEVSGIKGIYRDTWNSYYEFLMKINHDFSNYDENGAWPSIIDEYVEFCKENMNRMDTT